MGDVTCDTAHCWVNRGEVRQRLGDLADGRVHFERGATMAEAALARAVGASAGDAARLRIAITIAGSRRTRRWLGIDYVRALWPRVYMSVGPGDPLKGIEPAPKPEVRRYMVPPKRAADHRRTRLEAP